MNRFRKSEQGFTLVELLIVMAIIGILAAIAVPQFTKYRRNAAVSNCNSDLRNCMSEAAALFTQNASWSTNCTLSLPGNKFGGHVTVSENGTQGLSRASVTDAAGALAAVGHRIEFPASVYGFAMNATIDSNQANCTIQNIVQ